MSKFGTDNLSAPHTQRDLGAEPAPAVDVSTEAMMRLVERLRSQEAIPNRGEVADAITPLLADRDRLADEVARLTAGLSRWIDRAAAAQADVVRLREALAGAMDSVGEARLLTDTGFSLLGETVDYSPTVIDKIIQHLDAALRKGGAE